MTSLKYLSALLTLLTLAACEGDTIYYVYGGSGGGADAGQADAAPDATEPDGGEPGDILLGLLAPSIPEFTGPLPKAMQLAIDEVNASGGILGRQVRAEFAEEFFGESPVNPFRQLVEKNVAGVIGPATSSAFLAVPIAAEAELPFFSIYGGANSLWEQVHEETGPWGRSGYSFKQTFEPAATLAASQGCTTVGYIGSSEETEEATTKQSEDVRAVIEAEGMTWNGSAQFTEMQTDATEFLSVFEGDNMPSCFVMITQHIGIALRDSPEGFADAQHIILDGINPAALAEMDASAYEGAVGVQPATLNAERNEAYLQIYESAYGEQIPANQQQFFMANIYDFTALMLLSIEAAGSTNGVAIRAAVPSVGNEGDNTFIPGELAEALAALRNGESINYEGATGTADYTPGVYPVFPTPTCYEVTDIGSFATAVIPCEGE